MRHKILLIIALFAAACASLAAHTVERTYISTDRHYYAAGEKVHCSLFCSGPEGLSGFSGIAYLELSGADGLAATGKVSLLDGRGAGYLVLPSDLPTGNYALTAYTAVQKNETPGAIGYSSKIISVYNTATTARVHDGVKAGELPGSADLPVTGPVRLTVTENGLSLSSPEGASISVSIYEDNGLPSYCNENIVRFLGSLPPAGSFSDKVVPEYDGEIISVTVAGKDGAADPSLDGASLYLGAAGGMTDIYCSMIEGGRATYFTSNIYGDKNLAFSLAGAPRDYQVKIESPFVGVPAGDVPPLIINSSEASAIASLGTAAAISSSFGADTLFNCLPSRALPFTGDDIISYQLDDYTRFTTMQEIFTEYLFDMKPRRRAGKVDFRIRCRPYFGNIMLQGDGESLILLDGVPIMDHKVIYDYDPLLVKRIDIYPRYYALGTIRFEGIANFVTYKGNMPGINIGANTKILGFEGVSWPEALSGNPGSSTPRFGKTLLWQPLVGLSAGKETILQLSAPDYHGNFKILIEGITDGGEPVYCTASVSL